MEDLAHFIQSMSEKYGLLDVANKSNNKQTHESPTSGASNSHSNEECSAQASNWEYLSVISGQSVDSKAGSGSLSLEKNLRPTVTQVQADSTRQIDINEAPQSPLSTTSHVVIKEENDNGGSFDDSPSMVEVEQTSSYEKDFSNIVTMTDYLDNIYRPNDSDHNFQSTDNQLKDDLIQLQKLNYKSGEMSSGRDSSSPLGEKSREVNGFYTMDVDEGPSFGSSSKSHHTEGGRPDSADVEDFAEQFESECKTSTTGNMHKQPGLWSTEHIARRSDCKLRGGDSSERGPVRNRRQRRVVSSAQCLDSEAEFGDNVALHEYAPSCAGSSSRSFRTEGGGTDEGGYDNEVSALFESDLLNKRSNHRSSDSCSNVSHDEEGKVPAKGYSDADFNSGGTEQNLCDSLEEQEGGRESFQPEGSELRGSPKSVDFSCDEQEKGAGIGLSRSGYGNGRTEKKVRYLMREEQEQGRRGEVSYARFLKVGDLQEGRFRPQEQEREGERDVVRDVQSGTKKHIPDSTPGMQRREGGPSQDRITNLGGKKKRFGERGGVTSGRTDNFGDTRESFIDSIRVQDREAGYTSHDQDNALSEIYQALDSCAIHESRDRQGDAPSFGERTNFRGSDDPWSEEQGNNVRGEASSCRVTGVGESARCSDDAMSGEQKNDRKCAPQDQTSTCDRNQKSYKKYLHSQQDSGRASGSRERNKHVGDATYGSETTTNFLPLVKQDSYLAAMEFLSKNGPMQSRDPKLQEATGPLIARIEAHTFHIEPNQGTDDLSDHGEFVRKSPSDTPSLEKPRSSAEFTYRQQEKGRSFKSGICSELKKNSDESKRPQTAGSFTMPKKNKAGSLTLLEEAKYLESWDIGQELQFPSSTPWYSESIKANCVYINKTLSENGFSLMEITCMTPSPETFEMVLRALSDVLLNYERREKLVQELLVERDSLRLEEERNNQLTGKLEADIHMLKEKLASSEQRAKLATAASEKTFAALRKEHQRLEASHASMLQRCSQLDHVCRAKERSLRKLQEKIQEAVKREQSQRSRDKELYEKLKHKVAISQKAQGEIIESNFLLRDLKPACIVGIYERQRTAAEAEMNQLREENSRLCKELREKENSLLNKTMSTVEADLDQREQDLIQQLTEMDAAQERRNQQLIQEISKKKLELSTNSSTCQTSAVNGCTSLRCQEFVQEVCSKLKISDSFNITDAIERLLKVVAAVPRMESFIENVCEIVLNEGYVFLLSFEQTPEVIPDVLRSWLQQLQSAEELQHFKDSICSQLWERFDEKAEKHSMNTKLAAASVKDLINIEQQYLLSQQSYRAAQTLLKAEPEKLLHRIIGHFQMLFEIPHLEGVMAVMNSAYIQISEYHNFARALCSMLGLPKDSGANTIISTVTAILNKA